MPSRFEQEEPLARTDKERRADRCFDAYFVFETMPDDEYQRRIESK